MKEEFCIYIIFWGEIQKMVLDCQTMGQRVRNCGLSCLTADRPKNQRSTYILELILRKRYDDTLRC